MKAFLGMGLLGSNFVKAMLKRGEAVQVWNRTTSKAKDLEQFGAKAFENVQDAVRGAQIIHITLKDDAVVNEILAAAAPALEPGAIIIDHTTTSMEGAIERTKNWKAQGFTYQHAPVFMGPSNALEASGYMLVSGDQALIAQLEPELKPMTGRLLNLGEEPGKAAAMKLTGNTFLVCFTFGLRETMAVASSLGVKAAELQSLLTDWNPAAQAAARLKRLTADDHSQPSWELSMARKDTNLFLESVYQRGIEPTLLPVIANVMDKWIDQGCGSQDWTITGRDYRME